MFKNVHEQTFNLLFPAMPALLDYGEAVNKIKQLTAENEKYKNMVRMRKSLRCCNNYSVCCECNECNVLRMQIKSGKIVAEDNLDDLLSPTRAVVINEIIDDFAALSQ